MSNRWKDQTSFYDPEVPGNGNCMQASVASLLNLPLEEVPHFAEGGDAMTCWSKFEDFLEARGFYSMRLLGNHVPEVYYLASGRSSRGVNHMVVMKEGRLIHDPHPSREGVEKVDFIYVLIPIDASKHPLRSPERGLLPDKPLASDYLRVLKGLGERAGRHRSNSGKVTQFGWLPTGGNWVYFPTEFQTDNVNVTAFGGEVSEVNRTGFLVTSSSSGAFWIAETKT